jgi:transposase
MAELIRREFAIQYHRDHIGRLLHSLGWSVQKPERRALERDEEAIARWKRKDWPRIKKRCAAGRPPSVCRRIGIHAHPQRGAHHPPLHRRHSIFAAETVRLHLAVRPAFSFAPIRYIIYAAVNKEHCTRKVRGHCYSLGLVYKSTLPICARQHPATQDRWKSRG